MGSGTRIYRSAGWASVEGIVFQAESESGGDMCSIIDGKKRKIRTYVRKCGRNGQLQATTPVSKHGWCGAGAVGRTWLAKQLWRLWNT